MLQLNFTNIFWILVASISGALAPIIVKYYIKSNNVYLPILAWFVSGISIISFIFVFKSGDAISKSYPIIKGLTILFVILMAVLRQRVLHLPVLDLPDLCRHGSPDSVPAHHRRVCRPDQSGRLAHKRAPRRAALRPPRAANAGPGKTARPDVLQDQPAAMN